MTGEKKAFFRQRLHASEILMGSFVKTPTTHGTEILGAVGFDFVVIDQEHASFEQISTDAAILAARAMGIAVLVRVPHLAAILSVLDCGATGVLVPHVATAAYAQEIAKACHYRGGTRGYATSTRAGNYSGVPMFQHIQESDERVTVIAQIEDPGALQEIDEIAAVEGIDSLFIGRGDLTAAYGNQSPNPPEVIKASERIAQAAQRVNKPISVFVNDAQEAKWLRKLGATAFVISGDQSFLRRAAMASLADVKAAVGS